MSRRRRRLFAFSVVAAALGAPTYAATQYTITDIGVLQGDIYSVARSINDAGAITGDSNSTTTSRAFVWQSGTLTPLPTPSGNLLAYGSAINGAGDVAGGAGNNAVLWRNGLITPLGTLPGYQLTSATGVNAAGTVVGLAEAFSPSFNQRAFVQASGNVSLLNLPAGSTAGFANALSESGYIVGSAAIPGGSNALRWSQPAADPLVLSAGSFGTGASAAAVNELGNSAGGIAGDFSGTGQLSIRAAQWVGDVPSLLGLLPGMNGSEARGINDAGQIVGYSAPILRVPIGSNSLAEARATLWEGLTATDLNTLIPAGSGWTLYQAFDINNNGQIVGSGVNSLGQAHAFLLTPVPEPVQYVLMLAGLFAIGAWIKTRRDCLSTAIRDDRSGGAKHAA